MTWPKRLYAAGKIRDRHADEGFYTRLTRLEEEFPGAAVLIHIWRCAGAAPGGPVGVEGASGRDRADSGAGDRRAPGLEPAVENTPESPGDRPLAPGHGLPGPRRGAHPPAHGLDSLDRRGPVNGTLQVLRGGHRSGKVFRHRPERTRGQEKSWYLYIAEEDLPQGEVVTCEMPMGSLLLINQLIPHRSTENFSAKIRWSVDLRWQRPDEPSGFEKVKECILMRTARNPATASTGATGRGRIASPTPWTRRPSIRSIRPSPAHGSVAGPARGISMNVTVHRSSKSPFAPRKLRHFRGAKGDFLRQIPAKPALARERLRMNKTLRVILLFGMVIGLAACGRRLLGDDWPQWRGPTRDGVWRETG